MCLQALSRIVQFVVMEFRQGQFSLFYIKSVVNWLFFCVLGLNQVRVTHWSISWHHVMVVAKKGMKLVAKEPVDAATQCDKSLG